MQYFQKDISIVVVAINPIMSVNGSSDDGNCNLIVTTCNEPITSVLQDGIIPTLTGLDGDMWANQILTINIESDSSIIDETDITFDFEATPGYVGVQKVEVVMFNCPECRQVLWCLVSVT